MRVEMGSMDRKASLAARHPESAMIVAAQA